MPAMRVRLREGGSDTEVDTDAVGISLIEYRLGVPEVARLAELLPHARGSRRSG